MNFVCYERIILITCDTNLNYCCSALFLHKHETSRVQIRDDILRDGLVRFIPYSRSGQVLLEIDKSTRAPSLSFLTWEGLTSAAEIGIWSVSLISNNPTVLFIDKRKFWPWWQEPPRKLLRLNPRFFERGKVEQVLLYSAIMISNFVLFEELHIWPQINYNHHSNQSCISSRLSIKH